VEVEKPTHKGELGQARWATASFTSHVQNVGFPSNMLGHDSLRRSAGTSISRKNEHLQEGLVLEPFGHERAVMLASGNLFGRGGALS
jgi:hypothetical protein